MKISTISMASSLALAFALTACGGGGDSGPAADGASAGGPADITEYVGSWIRVDSDVCYAGFNYGPYWFKRDSFTYTSNTLEGKVTAYNDAACTSKAGRVIEKYNTSYTLANVAGKTNAIRFQATFAGSVTGADGGTGLTFNKIPDGTQTGADPVTHQIKVLLDVDNNQLFVGDKTSPPDADGYSTRLQATALYHR